MGDHSGTPEHVEGVDGEPVAAGGEAVLDTDSVADDEAVGATTERLDVIDFIELEADLDILLTGVIFGRDISAPLVFGIHALMGTQSE